MQFEAPLETHLSVDSRPEIYPLIELKDVYHRFVTVITTESEARILETTLGAITEEILTERPDLRERLGREWTREHYQNHKREREDQFIREKIRILEDLMNRRGHNHLIIAGSPKMVGRFTKALPSRLREKVISTVASNPGDDISPLLREAVHLFIAAENIESHHRVNALESALFRTGLAVVGFDDCRKALASGAADMLLVDQDHTEIRQREKLVRLAAEFEVPVETVNRNPALNRLGGFGCLLRYLPPGGREKRETRQKRAA
jgi:stalled ribosome rescue protein Dom34